MPSNLKKLAVKLTCSLRFSKACYLLFYKAHAHVRIQDVKRLWESLSERIEKARS